MTTEASFPQRRDDGSFTVWAWFASPEEENVVALVRDYVKAWVRANRTWVRIWRSNSIEEERLEFGSEFSTEPRVEEDAQRRRFAVVLEGIPSADRWRDWAAFMIDDLLRVFPEVRFEGFKS
jgi:hypothetical protein